MSALQGPSLLIYNDKTFSKDDWKGFTRNVGNSIKRADSETIGTFGLGAITMYHFTDVISVISGDQVLLLDIHKKYLPHKYSTIKGSFIEKNLAERFPDQFSPIVNCGLLGCNMQQYFEGTIFRLPLRSTEMCKISSISKRPVIIDQVKKMIEDGENTVEEMLLFLSNVESIEMYIWEKGYRAPRMLYGASISNISQEIRLRRQSNPSTMNQHKIKDVDISTFNIDITGINHQKTEWKSSWLICNGQKKDNEVEIDGRKLVSRAGIAVSMVDGKPTKCKGRGFCFLPILADEFNLPVHINGLFRLSDSRVDLWMSANDAKTQWNKELLTNVIGPIWALAIEKLTAQCPDGGALAIWPCTKITQPWNLAAESALKCLRERDSRVIPCEARWCSMSEVFLGKNTNGLHSILLHLGMNIVCLQRSFEQVLEEYGIFLPTVTPQIVSNFLQSKPSIQKNLSTTLQPQQQTQLLQYLVQEKPELMEGIPLLPLMNGSYATIYSSKKKGEIFYAEKKEDLRNLAFPLCERFVDIQHPSYKPFFARYHNDINITKLTPEIIAKSLPIEWRHDFLPREKQIIPQEWIKLFHKICDTWNTKEVESFTNFPLIPIEGGYASVTYLCKAGFVKEKDKELSSVMAKYFDYHCLDSSEFVSTRIISYMDSRLKTENLLLQAAEKSGVPLATHLKRMLQEDIQAFLTIRKYLGRIANKTVMKMLEGVPLFKAMDASFKTKDFIFRAPSPMYKPDFLIPYLKHALLDDDCPVNRLLSLPCTPSEQFETKLLRPALEILHAKEKNTWANIMKQLFDSATTHSSLFSHGRLQPDVFDVKFIEINYEWYSPIELLDPEALSPAVFGKFGKFVPETWKSYLPKLRLVGLRDPEEFLRKCARKLGNSEQQDHEGREIARYIVQSLSKIEHISNWEDIAFIPAARFNSNEAHSICAFSSSKSFYTIGEIRRWEVRDFVWTSAPVMDPEVADCAKHLLIKESFKTEELVSHFRNLISHVEEKWNVHRHMLVSDFDKMAHKILQEIEKRVGKLAREEPTQDQKKIRELLQGFPFIPGKTGRLPADRFCFPVGGTVGTVANVIPDGFREYSNLLRLLGAQDMKDFYKMNVDLPPLERLKEPLMALVKGISQAMNDPTFSDVTFVIEGRCLYAHRLILVLNSEKFKQQLQSSFQEGRKEPIIEIDDVTYDGFAVFLSYFYKGFMELENADLQSILDVVKLADEHMISPLKRYCDLFIAHHRTNLLSVENICDLFLYAEHYQMPFLSMCSKELLKNLKTSIYELQSFVDLPVEVVLEICGSAGVEMLEKKIEHRKKQEKEQEKPKPKIKEKKSKKTNVVELLPHQPKLQDQNAVKQTTVPVPSSSKAVIGSTEISQKAEIATILTGWSKVASQPKPVQPPIPNQIENSNKKNKAKKKIVWSKLSLD